MPKRNTESQPIASVLQNMIIGSKLENGLNKVAVESVWHEVMGRPISKYTKSIKWSAPVLYIYLSSSVLREELHYGKEKIIKMLNEALGQELVSDIVFK